MKYDFENKGFFNNACCGGMYANAATNDESETDDVVDDIETAEVISDASTSTTQKNIFTKSFLLGLPNWATFMIAGYLFYRYKMVK